LVNLCFHMVPTIWDKNYRRWQNWKFLTMEKMWKDKWNNLNSNYKKTSNYHMEINHAIHYGIWQLKDATTAIFQIKQFNKELYDVTQAFQKEMMMNALRHMKNLHAKGDIVIYMPPNAKLDIQYFFRTSYIYDAI